MPGSRFLPGMRRAVSTLILGSMAVATAAQETATPQNQGAGKIRITSEMVLLSVSVKDRYGNLVSELQRSEFRLFDDQVEQDIDVFATDALPLSLVVLVDNDLKWKEGKEMAASIRAIIGGVAATDEVMVCRFDMEFYPGEDFSRNEDKIMAELKEVQKVSLPTHSFPLAPVPGPSNSTTGSPRVAAPTSLGSRPSKALDDAIYSSAELLAARGADRRKIILLVSDGLNAPKLNRHTANEVQEKLLRENISVFSLATGSESSRKFERIKNYSKESGGDIYFATASSAMEQLYAHITEQARHEYVLAYIPRGNDRTLDYHRVLVQTTHPGLTVQARNGYYSDKAAAPVNP
ncbi:MAG: VWA domain-containing protein [Acidobacteriota bacterium]|nr:VWA domain-containing protein [Acidobacteriota bacterium]